MEKMGTWWLIIAQLPGRHCWGGLLRAKKQGLYRMETFDRNEYFYYDEPNNGDMHEIIPGKMIAFKVP